MKILLNVSKYLLLALIFTTHFVYYATSNNEGEFMGYLVFSNIINFFLILILFIKIKKKEVLRRGYYAPFSLNAFQIMVNRFLFLFKDLTITGTFFFSVILLFHQEIPINNRLLYLISLVLQQAFSLLLFITIWDFLVQAKLEQHLNVILPVTITVLIFARSSNYDFIYWTNPLGGIISLPLYIVDHYHGYYASFLIIPLLFGIVYIVNRLLLNSKPV